MTTGRQNAENESRSKRKVLKRRLGIGLHPTLRDETAEGWGTRDSAMSVMTTAASSAALRNDNKKNRQRHYKGTGNDTTKEQATTQDRRCAGEAVCWVIGELAQWFQGRAW